MCKLFIRLKKLTDYTITGKYRLIRNSNIDRRNVGGNFQSTASNYKIPSRQNKLSKREGRKRTSESPPRDGLAFYCFLPPECERRTKFEHIPAKKQSHLIIQIMPGFFIRSSRFSSLFSVGSRVFFCTLKQSHLRSTGSVPFRMNKRCIASDVYIRSLSDFDNPFRPGLSFQLICKMLIYKKKMVGKACFYWNLIIILLFVQR